MSQLQTKSVMQSNRYTHLLFSVPALLLLTLSVTHYAHAENTARIVKWKDEKGVTHYGDKIPPQYVNRENSLINKQGITVKQNKPEAAQDKAAELAKLEQDKKDRALLGTFTNAGEIDLTRDRNLEPDLLALKNLQQDRAVAQKKLDQSNASAESFTRAKKPVPTNLGDVVKTNKAELAKIDQRINDRQQAIDAIRKRFDEDKKRYLFLRNQADTTPGSAPAVKTDAAAGNKTK
jgi:hypothetical protein